MTPKLPPAALIEILEAEPKPQRAFGWNRDPWLSQMHDLPDVMEMLENLAPALNRGVTREEVLSSMDVGRVLPAFVVAMIWGYGKVGYGPTRVRWVLTGNETSRARDLPVDATVSDRLLTGSMKVRKDGPVEAFRFMNNEGKIRNLGSSFFTKWLYFVSAQAGPDDANAAPILDQRVVGWLTEHAGVGLALNSTDAYSQYLDLISGWGAAYNRTPVQVEKAIFGLATGRD